MNKKLLFFLLIPFLGFSQVQIGQDIDGDAAHNQSGSSVSLSSNGKVLAIGAPLTGNNGNNSGHVRVFEYSLGSWVQIGQDINGESAGDQSGWSVSLSSNGKKLAIGAPFNDGNGTDSGHVRLYEYVLGTWLQIGQDIDGESPGDNFGISVSLSSNGEIVAVGAELNDNPNGIDAGHVRVYKNITGVWTQVGQDIDGEAMSDLSSKCISLSSDGNTVAIGAHLNDGNGIDSGHVRIYENVSGVWTQIGQDINGVAQWEKNGISVSLSESANVLAVGSLLGSYINENNVIVHSGLVRIYKNISGTWTQIGLDIRGEALGDAHGFSVSLSSLGNIVAIGAYGNDGNGTDSGHVRIYENMSGVWAQIGNDIDGEFSGDQSGRSVSLSSDGMRLAIGAPYNGVNGKNSGHVRVYDISGILSTNEFVSQNFNIYPNPTSDILNINFENNLVLQEVTIYNNLGQMVKTATENVINVSSLAKGLYFVEVTTNQGKATKKVIIN